MGFWNKRIKDTKAIAKDIGVEEIKIKELKQGKREIGGETMEKVLNSIEKTKESKIEKQIRKAHIFEWYQNTDLTALRESFGFKTQKSLASELGVSTSTVCELEAKKKKAFSNSMGKIYDFYKDEFNKKITSDILPINVWEHNGQTFITEKDEEEVETIEFGEEVSQPEEVVMSVVEEEPVEEYKVFGEEVKDGSVVIPPYSFSARNTDNEIDVDFNAYRERIKVLEERCSMLERDNYQLGRQVMMYEKLIERL